MPTIRPGEDAVTFQVESLLVGLFNGGTVRSATIAVSCRMFAQISRLKSLRSLPCFTSSKKSPFTQCTRSTCVIFVHASDQSLHQNLKSCHHVGPLQYDLLAFSNGLPSACRLGLSTYNRMNQLPS